MIRFSRPFARLLITVAPWIIGPDRGARAEEPACAGRELAVANASLTDAKVGLDSAIRSLESPNSADLARMATWLGVRSSSDSAAVTAKLTRMRAFLNGVVFRCSVMTDKSLGDVYAYVDPSNSFVVTLGHFFFTAPESGFSSKMGVIVHEVSHFVLAGATKDPNVYGTEAARRLASSNPGAAQQNAENLEYFVEAVAFQL